MKFKILAPNGSEEIKEFQSHEEVRRYLLYKNDQVYRNDFRTEQLDFPLKEFTDENFTNR